MRKTVLAAVVVAIAIVVQLAVLNGLRLPHGGVPDLVLVLVAAMAMSEGPVRGMVVGFAAGLALDIAPPGSAVFGEYALVFCLAGWAAGQLSGLASRSALRTVLMLAGVVAVGEALVAGITLALDPSQVSLAQVRAVLPYTIAYDLILVPFAAYLALLAGAVTFSTRAAMDKAAGPITAMHGPRKPARKAQPHEPRLADAAGRPHDGWVGSRPSGLGDRTGARRRGPSPHGLRPGHGVAGSAVTGLSPRPGLPAAPVNLKFSGARRGDGSVASVVGTGVGRHPGLHPGLRAGGRGFRPHGGVPGGSAARQFAGMTRPAGGRPVSVRFGARRRDGSVGRLLGTPKPVGGGSQLLLDRSGRTLLGFRVRRATPKFRAASSLAQPRSRRKAVPRFRRAAASPALATGSLIGGSADHRAIMSARRAHLGTPSLHLSASRRGDGRLLGSVHGLHRSIRPATPRFRARRLGAPVGRPPKRPRFGHGRRSVLGFLTGHRIGGRWLASKRVGTRAGVWLLGRRTGGLR